MPDAEMADRLRRELVALLQSLSHLGYYETQGMLDHAEEAELARVRVEIPRLEQALAEAEGQSLTGDGSRRP